jgi:hypothetical protein
MTMAFKPLNAPIVGASLLLLLSSMSCFTGGGGGEPPAPPLYDPIFRNHSLTGVWRGQADGLDVEITLQKANCKLCCGGEGGYNYSYAPDGVQGASSKGVTYDWCGSRHTPEPGDSIQVSLKDFTNHRTVNFVLSLSDKDTLRGRVFGGFGMDGLSGSITLNK